MHSSFKSVKSILERTSFTASYQLSFLLLAFSIATVDAVTRTWDNGAGDSNWSSNNNWDPNGAEPENAGDVAVFGANNNSSVMLDQNATLAEVRFDDDGNWSIFDSGGNTITFDDNADSTANITITNTNGNGGHRFNNAIATNDNLVISNESTTDFSIVNDFDANSNQVDFTAGVTRFILNYSATELTNVYVSGGATVQFDTGYDVSQSGYLDVGTASGNGTFNLVGSGSNYTNNGGYIRLGTSAGATANMNMYGGALLTMTSAALDYGIYTGHTSGTSATSNIFGSGTSAIVDSYRVGGSGVGTGNISQSAVVTADSQLILGTFSGGNGTVNVSSGADLNATGTVNIIGREGTGNLTVTNSNSTFAVANDIILGQFSTGNGHLIVSNGALMTNTGASSDLIIGSMSGSIGSLDILNSGTTVLLNNVTVGDASSEASVMSLSDDATVSITSNLTVADDANSNGTITIQSGADLTVGGNVSIANAGTGTLIITGSSSTLDVSGNIIIGESNGSDGTLTISSAATIEADGAIYVGNSNSGTATLNLQSSDGIINNTDMVLAGGTLNPSGSVTQAVGGLGNLTMTENSIIDMDGGNHVINWNLIDENTWNGTLIIYNWDGTVNQTGGNDQLIFGDITGFNLAATQVYFYSGDGIGDLGFGRLKDIGGRWELVPFPEPSTYLGGGILIVLVLWRERTRITNLALSLRLSIRRDKNYQFR